MESVAPPAVASSEAPLMLPSRATAFGIARDRPTNCPSKFGLIRGLRGGSSTDLTSMDDREVAQLGRVSGPALELCPKIWLANFLLVGRPWL